MVIHNESPKPITGQRRKSMISGTTRFTPRIQPPPFPHLIIVSERLAAWLRRGMPGRWCPCRLDSEWIIARGGARLRAQHGLSAVTTSTLPSPAGCSLVCLDQVARFCQALQVCCQSTSAKNACKSRRHSTHESNTSEARAGTGMRAGIVAGLLPSGRTRVSPRTAAPALRSRRCCGWRTARPRAAGPALPPRSSRCSRW